MARKPRALIACAGMLVLAAVVAVPLPFGDRPRGGVRPAERSGRTAAVPTDTDVKGAGLTGAVFLAARPWIDALKSAVSGRGARLSPTDRQPPASSVADAPAIAAASPEPPPRAADLSGVKDAIALYRRGDLAGGDRIAQAHADPLARATLNWIALRLNPHDAGVDRIKAFLAVHPDWPASSWLRRRAEDSLYFDKAAPDRVKAFFGDESPLGPTGQLALARALMRDGATREAARNVAAVWRDNDLTVGMEPIVVKEFGGLLTAADDKFRADRLLYEGAVTGGLRAAARAGADSLLLARARIAAINSAPNAPALLDSVPVALRSDAGYQFARIVALRHSGKVDDAARLMLDAPRDPGRLVDGDAWWDERRMIARKLIDLGETELAYRICADNGAASHADKVDAEVHAGWIALRFLDDPARAMPHFVLAAINADTPDLSARATYWEGRAEDAMGHGPAAKAFYAAAARYPADYYGQLAAGKLGTSEIAAREAAIAATGAQRNSAIEIVEALYAVGERDLALSLAIEGAQHLRDEGQIVALGAVLTAYRDARATLILGKIAGSRGFAADDFAFPTFGVPTFDPVAHSADRSTVYAIARQESAFQTSVVSGAGARGLMQLLASTARETAKRAGIDFDVGRLTTDGAFNARIGAAYLGGLLQAEQGSTILTFAAYNAGAGRVQSWISAYGDPRDPKVDPVDWVELIPFDETRDYVKQVAGNLGIYQKLFSQRDARLNDRAGASRL